MVDSKESYKFDPEVKGLNNLQKLANGEQWSRNKKTEEGPKRRYQRYMYTFWGGGFKGHFSKQNVLFCGLEMVQGGREGGGGAGGDWSLSLPLSSCLAL